MIVEMLLTKGANVNAKDQWGQRPLHYVTDRSSVAVWVGSVRTVGKERVVKPDDADPITVDLPKSLASTLAAKP